MGLRVTSPRVWDSHTDWCSPRVGGVWDCPFEARKWPPVSQGLLSKAKLDLDSVLFHCGMEWGPSRGLSPKCQGSKAPSGCCLFSSKGRVSSPCFSRKGGVHLLAQEDGGEELLLGQCTFHTGQTTKTDAHKLCFHIISLALPSISLHGNTL